MPKPDTDKLTFFTAEIASAVEQAVLLIDRGNRGSVKHLLQAIHRAEELREHLQVVKASVLNHVADLLTH